MTRTDPYHKHSVCSLKLKWIINKFSVLLISLQSKIWQPKFTSKYKTPDYADDIDDGIFDYADFGSCIFCPDLSWEDAKRNDLIEFINDCDTSELEKNMKIGKNVDDLSSNNIIQIIQKYWDCFIKEGAHWTILGYEFGINTGDSKRVCCKKPAYGSYESKIIMEKVQQILANGWAKQCKGP